VVFLIVDSRREFTISLLGSRDLRSKPPSTHMMSLKTPQLQQKVLSNYFLWLRDATQLAHESPLGIFKSTQLKHQRTSSNDRSMGLVKTIFPPSSTRQHQRSPGSRNKHIDAGDAQGMVSIGTSLSAGTPESLFLDVMKHVQSKRKTATHQHSTSLRHKPPVVISDGIPASANLRNQLIVSQRCAGIACPAMIF